MLANINIRIEGFDLIASSLPGTYANILLYKGVRVYEK